MAGDVQVSDIKWTDVAIVIFTFGQVWVGLRQTKISREQIRITHEQTRIQQETREIANAALDRPYLIAEVVSHNFDEWQTFDRSDNKVLLSFTFRFHNYGKGPAVVENIVAHAFLSSGPWGRRTDTYPAVGFPDPQQLVVVLGDRPSVRVFPKTPLNDVDPVSGRLAYAIQTGTFTLRPDHESQIFNQFVSTTGSDERRDDLFRKPGIRPWLVGHVRYRGMFGTSHRTAFCFRGDGDGDGSAMEMYGAPYNERT